MAEPEQAAAGLDERSRGSDPDGAGDYPDFGGPPRRAGGGGGHRPGGAAGERAARRPPPNPRGPGRPIAEHVGVARRRAGFADLDRDFLAAARSVVSTSGYLRGGPYRRGLRTIAAPVLMLHGDRHPLVPLPAARAAARRNPSWSL